MKKKLLIIAAVLALGICVITFSRQGGYGKTIDLFENPTLYIEGFIIDKNADFDNYDATELEVSKYQELSAKLFEISKNEIKNLKTKKESKIESSETIMFGLEEGDNLIYFYDNGQILVEKSGKYYGYSYTTEDLNPLLETLMSEISSYNQVTESWYMMVE